MADWDTWAMDSVSLALDGEHLALTVVLDSATVGLDSGLDSLTVGLDSVTAVLDWVSLDWEDLESTEVASLLLDCVSRDLELVIWAIWASRVREEEEDSLS